MAQVQKYDGEKFVKFKTTEHLEIGQYFRDENCDLWRDIETEALEYASEKKSSISQLPSGNETLEWEIASIIMYFNMDIQQHEHSRVT